MRICSWMGFVVAFLFLATMGCSEKQPEKVSPKSYDVHGKVTAIRPDQSGVTLDHDDIPGLMKAMTMEFPVKDAKILDGLEVGDHVEGKLLVESGKYFVTELKKR
jgi:Cu/Ag efflux protein CusF